MRSIRMWLLLGCAAAYPLAPSPLPRCMQPVCTSTAPVQEEELLLSKDGLQAFVTAELRSFVLASMVAEDDADRSLFKRKPWLKGRAADEWRRSGVETVDGIPDEEYSAKAVETICETAEAALLQACDCGVLARPKCQFQILGVPKGSAEHELRAAYKGLALELHPDRFIGAPEHEAAKAEARFKEAGEAMQKLTHPRERMKCLQEESREAMAAAAVPFLQRFFEGNGELLRTPLERTGLSSDDVATHLSDMYHHRIFAGDDKVITRQPSGTGEAMARAAVGLPPLVVDEAEGEKDTDVEECEVWGPNNVCLQTKAEAAAWRKRRFEKVQIEGTRGLGHR